jgi:hypothetical protein
MTIGIFRRFVGGRWQYVEEDAAGGSLPETWTATDNNLVIPVDQPDGGTAGSPFSLTEVTPGLLPNSAGGFVSEYEVFDLGRPGVGYGKMTVTALDGDGETFTIDSGGIVWRITSVEISPDGDDWENTQGVGTFESGDAGTGLGSIAYLVTTPRLVRFRLAILWAVDASVYDGANTPSVTYDFAYTAG